MKVVAMSDLHAGSRRWEGQPGARAAETAAVLDWFVALVEDEQAELAVWAGDTFDSRRPAPRELRMVAAAASRIARTCPLVIVGGNHDGPSVVGDPDSHTLGWLDAVRMHDVYVATEPRVIDVGLRAWGTARVYAEPYPHPRSLDGPGTIGERQARVSEAVQRRALDWAADDRGEAFGIYVGHLSVAGATLGAERTMRAGWDVTISASALEGYDLALLGHLHAQQRLRANAWYCGSPMRWDWSEEGQRKGALVADVAQGEEPRVRAVDFPARPVRTVDLTYRALTPSFHSPAFPSPAWRELFDGAMVRLRVDADRRPEAAWRARLEREAYAAGAHFVRVDVSVVRAAEAPRERASLTAEERLRAWLDGHGGADAATLVLAREVVG